jgi:hypothetical protein
MKICWQCNICKDKVVSDTTERHKADYCKCGQSMVDAEDFYARYSGDIQMLDPTDEEVTDYYKKKLRYD